MGLIMSNDLYIDEPCVISFFLGELGWLMQYWQGYLRYLKTQKYPDHKFIFMTNLQFYPIVDDFVKYTLDLPKEFYDLNLETDCYEAPLKNSPPGSLTPPDVWASLVKYIRNFYNVDKAVEIWTPRGYNKWIDGQPQTFNKYQYKPIQTDKPIICIFPRRRDRALQRNIPEFIWKEVVDSLSGNFTVVLGGTPSGSSLVDYSGKNIINLINYSEQDKLEKIMQYITSSVCTLSSQSGLSHVSLLCGAPTYMIGHERERHSRIENRLSTPVSFREVSDYRAVSAEEILNDVGNFLRILQENNILVNTSESKINRPSLRNLEDKKDLIGVEIGVDRGLNAENMLENLDIKTLYLIDPYDVSDGIIGIGCQMSQEQCIEIEKEARERLSKYEDKIVWIKGKSSDVYTQIPDNLDFIYIDGNHRYDSVKEDINNYFNKVKEGGLVAGHDYAFEQVKSAVDELFGNKVNIEECADWKKQKNYDWWIVKGVSFDFIINENIDNFNEIIKDRG